FTALVVGGAAEPAAVAETITVNSSADASIDDGDCTLREAVAAAEGDIPVDACTAGSGADEIVFDAALAGQTIALTVNGDTSLGNSALLITTELTIAGSGVVLDAGTVGRRRHFLVTETGKLTLQDIVLTGGGAVGGNGGSGGKGGGGGGGGLGGSIFNR